MSSSERQKTNNGNASDDIFCTDRLARMMAVIREKTMLIFSFSQPSATTGRHRMIPVTASNAAYRVSVLERCGLTKITNMITDGPASMGMASG